MDLTLVALACNILLVATGIFVARNTMRRFRFTNVYGMWMKAISDEHMRHFTCVRRLLLQGHDGEALMNAIESDEATRRAVLYVVDHWTVLGTGVRYGLFDRAQAIWMNGQQITYFFEKLRPWLAYRRKQTPESAIFHDFGWLYLQCREMNRRIERRNVRPEVQQLFASDESASRPGQPPNKPLQPTGSARA